MCDWNDHGLGCSAHGILSLSTNGAGPWYCREHFERIQGRAPNIVGNRLPEPSASQAVREYHAANIENAWAQAIRENEKFDLERKAAA